MVTQKHNCRAHNIYYVCWTECVCLCVCEYTLTWYELPCTEFNMIFCWAVFCLLPLQTQQIYFESKTNPSRATTTATTAKNNKSLCCFYWNWYSSALLIVVVVDAAAAAAMVFHVLRSNMETLYRSRTAFSFSHCIFPFWTGWWPTLCLCSTLYLHIMHCGICTNKSSLLLVFLTLAPSRPLALSVAALLCIRAL